MTTTDPGALHWQPPPVLILATKASATPAKGTPVFRKFDDVVKPVT